jgi:hypothetical protein
MIFGIGTDSDVELSDEFNVQDHVLAGSAVCSGKKRAAPEKVLNLAQKMEAMKYFGENPGMTYPKLIEWCYTIFSLVCSTVVSPGIPKKTFSTRSKPTTLLQYDFTAEPAAAQAESVDYP